MCLGGEGEGGNIARVLGRWRVEPKANRNLSLGAESYVTITLKGFSTVSQILLNLIVCARFEWHIQLQMG